MSPIQLLSYGPRVTHRCPSISDIKACNHAVMHTCSATCGSMLGWQVSKAGLFIVSHDQDLIFSTRTKNLTAPALVYSQVSDTFWRAGLGNLPRGCVDGQS